MTAPVDVGPRSATGLAFVVVALSLALIVPPPARAAPPTPTVIARSRLSLGLPQLELRLGASDPRLQLGTAVGSQLARDDSMGVSLAARLRLGAADGVNVTAGYDYLLPRADAPGRRLGPHGAISVPLRPGLALTGEGSFLGDGGGLGTIGLSQRLDVGGQPWFLSAALGFSFRRADGDCRGGGQWRVNAQWCAVPAALFGIEGRF